MGDVPGAGRTRADPTTDGADTRLAELETRSDELVRAWLVKVVGDLSLREVGRLRLDATVEAFVEIYDFVIDATRTERGGGARPVDDWRYSHVGRVARETMGGALEGDGAVRALGRLQELLERELRGSALAPPRAHGDSTVKAVVAVCERLTAAAADEAATDGSDREEATDAGGSAA